MRFESLFTKITVSPALIVNISGLNPEDVISITFSPVSVGCVVRVVVVD